MLFFGCSCTAGTDLFLGSLKTPSFFFLKSLRFSFYVLTLLSSSCYQLVKGYGLTGCWAALVGFQWVRLTNILTTPACKNLWFGLIYNNKSCFRPGFSLLSGAFFLQMVCCTPKIWPPIHWGSSKLPSFGILILIHDKRKNEVDKDVKANILACGLQSLIQIGLSFWASC